MLGKIYLEGLLQPLRSQSPGVGLSKALFSTFPFSSSDVYGSYNDAAVELSQALCSHRLPPGSLSRCALGRTCTESPRWAHTTATCRSPKLNHWVRIFGDRAWKYVLFTKSRVILKHTTIWGSLLCGSRQGATFNSPPVYSPRISYQKMFPPSSVSWWVNNGPSNTSVC